MGNSDTSQAARRLEAHLGTHPTLTDHIYRQLLLTLHARGIVTLEALYTEAQAASRNVAARTEQRDGEPQRSVVEKLIHDYASTHFRPSEIDELIAAALQREQVRSLLDLANRGNIPFGQLAQELRRFCAGPWQEASLLPEDAVGTRVALTRHLISDQLEYLAVAKKHLQIRHFDELAQHVIGPPASMGRIGGKAGGMVLAGRILEQSKTDGDTFLPLATPESFFLRSDVVQDFLQLNHLNEYQSQKYKPIEQVARDYPLIREVFRGGLFPPQVVNSLGRMLARTGSEPLIVRSSSLLEDRFGAAFYGKYASVFLANQGSLGQRLKALLSAIAEVYASVFAPEPILYRREHDLLDYVEEMAVLIQKVVGCRFGSYFLPAFAGVAFSRNEYRWSPRIRREDGLARIVMGLGTRAVDRGGADYPKMVALGAPTLSPESDMEETRARAQRKVDLIDLAQEEPRAVPLEELLARDLDFPLLDLMVSKVQEGEIYSFPGKLVTGAPSQLCITFDKLLRSTPFAAQMRTLLATLADALGRPIEIEFACDGKHLYLLQCRSQARSPQLAEIVIPPNVPAGKVIFDAHKYIRSGLLRGIEYVVYVDPQAYDAIPEPSRRTEIAHAVGRVNRTLPRGSFILMGPGRWGTRDVGLGVPVRYADINHAALLVEVARLRAGFVPAVSFGTHFFQDLVEAGIHYLPLYPDEAGNRFNEEFFLTSANLLPTLLPQDAAHAAPLRVIHVPAVAGGLTLTVAMDGERDQALAYLE